MRCNFLQLVVVLLLSSPGARCACSQRDISHHERRQLRDEVVEAFHHAYGAYMTHAYPADELMPLSCTSRRWDHRTRGDIDDVLGGYGLTMVDSLDMHAILGEGLAFRQAVETVLRDFQSGLLSFDRDVVVSVFEASIRVLGGLLSAHQIASELNHSGRLGPPGWYSGGLLDLAYDLGKRLLPAFDTPLGIPVHRVNLRMGIPRGETRSTCAAAAGTFLLEFGALSRLTRDPSFEAAARRAVTAVWSGRSPLGLVGGGLDGTRGVWKSGHAGIGAGTDSFYEYLYKSARLLGDDEMGSMFLEAYRAVETNLRWHGWHIEMDRVLGNKVPPFSYRVSALQAFWPTMQVAAGDLEAAEETFDSLFDVWGVHKAMPDVYDILSNKLLHYGRDSPLRPELAESALALYRATGGSTRYLSAGAEMFRALQSKSRVECGYASIGDVMSGALDDRMDSYFLSETLKYLFLLFDSSLPPEDRQSLFCTPEQEAASAFPSPPPVVRTNESMANALGSGQWNASCKSVSVGADGELGRGSCPSAAGGHGGDLDQRGDNQNTPPAVAVAKETASGPRCIRWRDAVMTTEGHPLLVRPLASPRQPTPKGRSGGVFDPKHYYRPAVASYLSHGALQIAELEVKCFANGKCHFHDSGPKFLPYLRQASGGKWTSALSQLCEWVRETAFSFVDRSSLEDGQGITYRLQATMPANVNL